MDSCADSGGSMTGLGEKTGGEEKEILAKEKSDLSDAVLQVQIIANHTRLQPKCCSNLLISSCRSRYRRS